MPWRDTSPLDQKPQFIADDLRRTLSITEVCALYSVSRKTGYKWIERYLKAGPSGSGGSLAPTALQPPSDTPARRRGPHHDDGIWNVYFGPLKLGRLLERHMRIEDAYDRLKRRR